MLRYEKCVPLFLVLTFAASLSALELKQVQVVWRHGDRTPITENRIAYPTDPYINDTYPPWGLGGLTATGTRRSIALGSYLRDRYFERLGILDNSTRFIRVNSSSVKRCFDSTRSFLQGLIPTNNDVPIHQRKSIEDVAFLALVLCPKFRMKQIIAQQSLFEYENTIEWNSLKSYISKHLKLNATLMNAFGLFDSLRCQDSLGYVLPEWTRKMYASHELERMAAYFHTYPTHTIELKRLFGGVWISEFLSNIDALLEGKNDSKKLHIYSGHDTNIIGILSMFDAFGQHIPMFCNSIMLELYHDPENEGSHYVKIFYRNMEKVSEVPIKFCDSPCPLRQFRDRLKALIPENALEECSPDPYVGPEPRPPNRNESESSTTMEIDRDDSL